MNPKRIGLVEFCRLIYMVDPEKQDKKLITYFLPSVFISSKSMMCML